jgi:hypothetical protein
MPLDSCDHVFHEDCLKEYLEMKIQNKDDVILCPDAKCKIPMVVEDMTAVLGEEKMEAYYAFTLDKAVDGKEGFMWCLTKGCEYVFAYSLEKEEGDDEVATDYECPKCL